MTDKKLDQQSSNVRDQTRPQTEGSKVSTGPQDGSLDETALDKVSGGIGSGRAGGGGGGG